MYPKFLLIALSVAAFSSCSTAYKSGQTPDDVYYSPLKTVDENSDKKKEDDQTGSDDRTIRMKSRDHRWRVFDEDYNYENSPYNYCYCNCHSYGYYYNPYYFQGPVYSKIIKPVNTSPRMVNLNAYTSPGQNSTVIPKGGSQPRTRSYNNSNTKTGVGKTIRGIFSGLESKSSSGETRTYSPSSGSSSGKSSSGSVSRPNRGG